jgi:DNA-binding SARP family transcriptional activator/tetratricopeptide (TPR) repeat protein
MITEAERLGLLGRRAKRRSSEQRYHPLVREFLEDRLRREIGPSGVDELHVRIAQWAEPHDWQSAAYHYTSARDAAALVRVIDAHLDTIVGTGAVSTAFDYYRSAGSPVRTAGVEVLESRRASREGDVTTVLKHAAAATALDPENEVVMLNAIASHTLSGDLATAQILAEALASRATTPETRRLAEGSVVVFGMSIDGDMLEAAATLADLADWSRSEGRGHYEGVSELNGANVLIAAGRFDDALGRAQAAIDALTATSSGTELKSAIYAKAAALAYLGDFDVARALLTEAGSSTRHSARAEYLAEHGDIEAQLGSASVAANLLSRLDERQSYSLADLAAVARAVIQIREGDIQAALEATARHDLSRPSAHAAMKSRVLATRALAAVLAKLPDASATALEAVASAGRQRAVLWEALANLALAATSGHLDSALRTLGGRLTCVVSMAAELVLAHLDQLGPEARNVVISEAVARPDRWLPAIRMTVADQASPVGLLAARVLAEVGTRADIPTLTAIGKSKRATSQDRLLGRTLARRLAPVAEVSDLGRVSVTVGARTIPGQDLRRKVLALLCYLLTRPRYSATREEVMEAMWPEMAPATAVNSLNQSVYFLRRVFEPEYADDATAGYVRQDSDLLWLDPSLVDAASTRCARLLADYERTGNPETALALSEAYTERFALDFAYEEWASDYREWLHVSCLRILENEVRRAANDGAFDIGIAVARRALQTDPRNDALEASLLRLLRGYGAHAAAAEQYGRYSTLLRRDLGVEAPPADEV